MSISSIVRLFILIMVFSSICLAKAPPEPESMAIWNPLASITPGAEGKPNRQIGKLLQKPIQIAGYLIANEFNAGELTEFLLAQYPTGCIHVPLPSPNHMIHVTMASGKTASPLFGKKVVVSGKLSLGGRVDSSYEMVADVVQEFPYSNP